MGKITNRQSLAFAALSTLAGHSAVPRETNVKRMNANRTIQIAAQRTQGLWGPISVFWEWYDRITAILLASDSAITIARFRPSKLRTIENVCPARCCNVSQQFAQHATEFCRITHNKKLQECIATCRRLSQYVARCPTSQNATDCRHLRTVAMCRELLQIIANCHESYDALILLKGAPEYESHSYQILHARSTTDSEAKCYVLICLRTGSSVKEHHMWMIEFAS